MDQSPHSKASVVLHRQESTFLGPIPPPSLLTQYNEIIPDGANRIMAMAERQSAHREAMEAKVIEGNIRSQGRGNIFAFIIVLIALLGAFVLLFTGRNMAGRSTFVVSIATPAGLFLVTRNRQRGELAEKAAEKDRRTNAKPKRNQAKSKKGR
jgi:uncharacterized membrane protein